MTIVGGTQEVTGQEVLGTPIQTLLALFYTNDGIVASPERAHLQVAFDALTGLFDQVFLRTNEGKMVIMA